MRSPVIDPPAVPAATSGRVRTGWLAGASGLTALLAFAAAAIAHVERFDYFLTLPVFEPLPFASLNGFTPAQLADHLARFLFLTPAVLCFALATREALGQRSWTLPRLRWIALGGAAWVGLLAVGVLRGIPLQDDEPTYLMQAAHLAHGHLFLPPVHVPWAEPFTIFTSHGTTGKYLFGEPLALVPGTWLHFPLLGQLLLVAGTIALVGAAASVAADRATNLGLGAALLLALSPELAFTSATPLSQVPALFGLALAVWALERPSFRGGLWIGVGLGIAMISRPQMMLPAAVGLLLCRKWDLRRLAGALLAGLPFLVAILLYDRALTGNAFQLPWALYDHERLGFGHTAGSGYLFTPFKSLLETLVVGVRLNGWALGWPISWLGPLAWAAQRFPRRRAVTPWLAMTLATFAFQFFYFTPGTSETGALYHYVALPFFATSTAAAIEALLATRHRATTLASLAGLVGLGTLSFDLDHAARLRRLTDAIRAPYQVAEGLKHDLVLVYLAADAPYAGMLLGVPYRSRAPGDPVIYFPYSSEQSAQALRAQFADRPCHFLYWAEATSDWKLTGCDAAPAIAKPGKPPETFGGTVDAFPEWRPAFGWLLHPLGTAAALLGR